MQITNGTPSIEATAKGMTVDTSVKVRASDGTETRLLLDNPAAWALVGALGRKLADGTPVRPSFDHAGNRLSLEASPNGIQVSIDADGIAMLLFPQTTHIHPPSLESISLAELEQLRTLLNSGLIEELASLAAQWGTPSSSAQA